MTGRQIEDTLRNLAERRAKVEAERHAIARERIAAVKAARNAGMSVTRIAEVGGLTRQSVHRMLRE
jgi:predicted transcriptional regulator